MATQSKYDKEKKKDKKTWEKEESNGRLSSASSKSNVKSETSTNKKTDSSTSSSSSSSSANRGSANRGNYTPKYNAYNSKTNTWSYVPKSSTTQTAKSSTSRTSGTTAQKTTNVWDEWLDFVRRKTGNASETSSATKSTVSAISKVNTGTSSKATAARGSANRGNYTPKYNTYNSKTGAWSYNPYASETEDERAARAALAQAGAIDLGGMTDLEDTRQRVLDAAIGTGTDSIGNAKFISGSRAYKADMYRQNLIAGLDELGLSEEERNRILGEADSKVNTANEIYALARTRTGELSAADELTGDARVDAVRLARLYGYDVTGNVLQQQLPSELQQAGTAPIEIPEDYDSNSFNEDRYVYKFGERIGGGAVTEAERQEAKRRLETVLGIDDADTVTDWSAVSFDPDYVKDLNVLNSSSTTYQDVLNKTTQYDADKIADDILILQDYYANNASRSPDEVQRAGNRVKAATGVDVLNAADFESAFDRAIQTNEALRNAVSQAVYDETGQMPAGAEFDMDDYLTYMRAYMQQQNRVDHSEAEQMQFDDTIQQKYGQYESAANYAVLSQPISLDITPTTEAEAIHEAIVGIDDPELFDALANPEPFGVLADDTTGMPTAAQQKYTADTITSEQRKMFNYLWNSGRQDEAMEYLDDIDWSVRKAIAAKTEEVSAELSEGVGGGIGSSFASVLMSPARAVVAPVNAARTALGQEIDEYDQGFNVGRASDTIRGNVGQNLDELLNNANILGWNIGSGFYQGAMSIADSWMTAPLGANLGAATMGLEAADSAMREGLEKGRTQGEALRDAAVTAGVEWATEKLPLENLFGDVGSPGKYIVSNMLSEMGEEVTSEVVEMIYDTLAYGDESDLGDLRNQLVAQGYVGKDVTVGLLKEIAGRIRDAGFGGAAGGLVGAAPRAAVTAVSDRSSGKNLQANDAARSMLDLAGKMLPDGEVKNIATKQLQAINGEGETSNAKVGRVYRELLNNIDEQTRQVVEDTMLRNVKAQLKEMGESDTKLAEAVTRVVAGDGSAQAEDYMRVGTSDAAMTLATSLTERVNEVRKLNEQADELAKKASKKSVAETVTPTTENTEDESAGEAVDEEDADWGELYPDEEGVDDVDEEDTEVYESEASTTSDGEEVSIVGVESVGTDGELKFKIQTADGQQQTVAASELNIGSNDDASARLAEYARQYGANADTMFNARLESQDVDAYAEAFQKAVEYGSDGRNLDVVSKYSSLSDLHPNQIKIAYELGRAERKARTDLTWEGTVDKITASGAVTVGNVDVSQIKSINSLNRHQKDSIVAMRGVAELLGINVEFFESAADEQGKYSDKQGSWDPNTLTLSLDIHAGSNSAVDLNYAIMHTAGHELTHMIFEFADSKIRNAYQEFVMDRLSQKMSAEDLDARIEKYLNMPGVKSRDAAIEEIVAESSVEALGKMTEADIEGLMYQNRPLYKRIAYSISQWVRGMKKKIANAFKGTEAKNEYAKMLNDQLDELAQKWNAALKIAVDNKNGTLGTETVTEADVDSKRRNKKDPSKVRETQQEARHLQNRHIDQRSLESVGRDGEDTTLFCSEVEEVQVAFAEAAKILLDDLNNTMPGKRLFIWDEMDQLTVSGQKRSTSDLLADIKDSTHLTWDQIKNSLQQFEDMGNAEKGYPLPKNNVPNRRMELYLDDLLSKGYTTIEGYKIAPWDEYIKLKSEYQGSMPDDVSPNAYKDAIPFEDFAFAGEFDEGVKYSARESFGDQIDKLRAGTFPRNDHLYVMDTPDVLYVDKKRSHALEKSVGVQFPKKLFSEASDNSITENGDEVKFSMRQSVERTRNLVAVHNIREDNLRKALDLGGFPMPSIAIAKNDIGHQNFGAISLVFGSDTIDPKANKRNKAYSADAWTPTFPMVEYEVDAKADTRIYNKLTELKRKVDPYFADDLRRMMYDVEDQLNRNGGEEGLVKRALDNYGMKAAYLESIGEHANVEKKTVSEERKYNERQSRIYEQIADLVGLDNIRKMPTSQIYSQYGEAINDIYPGAIKSEMRFRRILVNVSRYFIDKDNVPGQTEITDPTATREAIDAKINPSAYERWVRDMYSGIVRGSGVYNGKELFTPSGNRRSFAATHYTATVEGIAKAMYDAHGGKVKNISANHDAKSLRAVTAKSFKSIDEMHDNVGRLKARTQEEADALTSSLDKRLADLTNAILETKARNRDVYESLMAHDHVVAILQEVAEKKYSAATIKSAYAGYGYNITSDTAKELKTLLDDISVMPVNIFEAKPERAVYFDEVKYAIVPDTMDAELRRRLEELVPDVREYTDGDEAQRLELLNAREDLMFQNRDPDQISNRELLANAMDFVATNEAELDFVRRYRNKIQSLNEKQAQYEQARQEVADARNQKKSKADIAALENKAKILGNQLDRLDGQLLKFEAGKPLQDVVKRQREQLNAQLKQKQKTALEKQRARLGQQKQEALQKLRDKRNADLARQREQLKQEKVDKVREVREAKDESFAKKKYLKAVEKEVSTLREWVTSPTTKAHVPQFLRVPLGDVISAMDFSSKRSLNGGRDTQKDIKFKDALDRMNTALTELRTQRTTALANMANKQGGIDGSADQFALTIDLPEGYNEAFTTLVQDIKDRLDTTQSSNTAPINRMTSTQLKELTKAVRTLATSIRQMNRLLANAKYDSAVTAARDTMNELGKMKPKKDSAKATAWAGRFLDWTNTVPYYAFKRFGSGGKAIFEGLMDGWDKLAFNSDSLVKFANDTYTTKEVRKWSKQLNSVTLDSGDTVRMTTAQMMSLYCLSKRQQAVGHLLGGGIRIADIDNGSKVIRQVGDHTLTQHDLQTVADALTERQRTVADKLQDFMSTQCSEWGNEVSMKRFGYKMFSEKHYFPIEVDTNNLSAVDEKSEGESLFRLLNMSSTKGLKKGANNAIVIHDIFNVFSSHSSDMAKYNALGLQILDAMKWLNYVEGTKNPDGSKATRSVQESLERAYGTDARRYILNLLRDLNGTNEGGRNDGIINKVISNEKVKDVGSNLRVFLLQITSFPRAAYAISPKYLSIGLAKAAANPVKTAQIATDKVGIAKWKDMGFYDTNISRNIREMVKHDQNRVEWIREKSLAPAGVADNLTMGTIYYAVEAECAKRHPNVQKGSAVWDKLVNNRVREIVYQTQVVDSTMTRSDIMRGKGIATLTTAFMSEPTLTLNMLADGIYEARMAKRSGESIKAPTAKLARGLAAAVATGVFAAVFEAAFDAARDDDEFETFGEKYMAALIGDFTEDDTGWQKFAKVVFSDLGDNLNFISNIPGVSKAFDIIQGYDDTTMYTEFMNNLKDSYDAYQSAQNGDGTVYNWIYKGLKGLSGIFGLPVSNVTREAVSIWNTFFADWADKPRIQTRSNTESQAAEAIVAAQMAGDTERVARIRQRASVYGMDEEKINKKVAKLAEEALAAGKLDRSAAEGLMTGEGNLRASETKSALNSADYQLATGGLKLNEMGDDYIAGTITEAEARKYLAEYKGLRGDEIDETIGKWNYEKDTGMTYSEMKTDYLDGVLSDSEVLRYRTKYGGVEQESAQSTLDHWKYEADTGLAWDDLEADYGDGIITESQVRQYLAKYDGKTEAEIDDKVNAMDYHIATGRTGTCKYWRIAYAFDNGQDYTTVIDEAFEKFMYGGEEEKTWKQARSAIVSSLASYYKVDYLPIKGTAEGDAMVERILDLFEAIGYEREYQRDYIAKNW